MFQVNLLKGRYKSIFFSTFEVFKMSDQDVVQEISPKCAIPTDTGTLLKGVG